MKECENDDCGWDCQHEVKGCKNERECRRDWQCQHDWLGEEYTQEGLKSLLDHLERTPKGQDDIFMRPCKKCEKESSITSFRLYERQPKDSSVGSIESITKCLILSKFLIPY